MSQNSFKTFKERGEWVELCFMTRALEHGYKISKPWGDSSPYDVGVSHGSDILRVQVKSTTVRTGTGYFCQFKPHFLKKQDYTLQQVDLFAAGTCPERRRKFALRTSFVVEGSFPRTSGISSPPPSSSARSAKPDSCSTPWSRSKKTATNTKPIKKLGRCSPKANAR